MAREANSHAARHALRAWFMCCALLTAPAGTRSTEPYSEEAVKAAFIYRFIGYVEWPADAPATGPLTIAVLGDSVVAANLQSLVQDRMLRGRRVQVRRIANVRDAPDAQVLYVGRDRRADLRSLLAPLSGRRVLIISDDRDGLEAGSAVNFLRADDRVRFEVSLPAAQQAGLKISSELLSVAARVQQ